MEKICIRTKHSDNIRINIGNVIANKDFVGSLPTPIDKLIEEIVRRSPAVKDTLFRRMKSHGSCSRLVSLSDRLMPIGLFRQCANYDRCLWATHLRLEVKTFPLRNHS